MADFAAPRKSLGQNFLQDPNIIRKIVASLNVQESDVVIEIGPGRGALTEQLLDLGAELHLIEFDRDLSAYWRERAAGNARLIVHEADVLAFDFSQLTDPARPLKIIGNLPYNISSPILFALFAIAPAVRSQVVMLQKEVVERMSSSPGSKQFGRLSVMLQYRYQIENLFTVPPTAFYPPPKVESAIARLTPYMELPAVANSERDLQQLVKQAFSQRRKTLRNNLKGLLTAAQIEQAGIDPGRRAETLQVADFVTLSNLLR
jgi:16S rRNA (adenine1518-N6/adenine1519-N6)-dimethyltransferase